MNNNANNYGDDIMNNVNQIIKDAGDKAKEQLMGGQNSFNAVTNNIAQGIEEVHHEANIMQGVNGQVSNIFDGLRTDAEVNITPTMPGQYNSSIDSNTLSINNPVNTNAPETSAGFNMPEEQFIANPNPINSFDYVNNTMSAAEPIVQPEANMSVPNVNMDQVPGPINIQPNEPVMRPEINIDTPNRGFIQPQPEVNIPAADNMDHVPGPINMQPNEPVMRPEINIDTPNTGFIQPQPEVNISADANIDQIPGPINMQPNEPVMRPEINIDTPNVEPVMQNNFTMPTVMDDVAPVQPVNTEMPKQNTWNAPNPSIVQQPNNIDMPKKKWPLTLRETILVSIALIGVIIVIIMYT